MTRIKVCGLTNLGDALAAVELGADALGFVFAERSKRKADPETVAKIIREIPPFISTVGVFRDQPLSEVRGIMEAAGLCVAQLHGAESLRYMEELGRPALKALSVAGMGDLQKMRDYPGVKSFLLDSGEGGTGEVFDWSVAVKAAETAKIALAGGLTPDNVERAVKVVRPWAVDVCSGVEKSFGIKDHGKLRSFIAGVKAADAAFRCRTEGFHD